MGEIANNNIDPTFRLSFATITSRNEGAGKLFEYPVSMSLSKAEVMKLGGAKVDSEICAIRLSCFWKRIGRNQFCLPDGGVINSRTTLQQYFVAGLPHFNKALTKLTEQHIYTIFFKESVVVTDPKRAGDVALDLNLHTFENKPTEFGKVPEAPGIDPSAVAKAGEGQVTRPGQMSVDNWNEVMVVNNLLNGFYIDQKGQTITKARKAAFKLEPNPIHPLMFSPGTLSSAEIEDLKKRAKDNMKDWHSPIAQVDLSLNGRDVGDENDPDPPLSQPLDHLYPAWEVCDDSKIKIENITSPIQLASAEQGFSKTSVEAAVAASVVSISAGWSAGFSTGSSISGLSKAGEKSEQMHATCEFPRVRLYLDERSVSLSSDCANAIKNVGSTKSYKALMDFYRDYGHVFVTKVKLGGRLCAKRFLSAQEARHTNSTQNAWKASIAASFKSDTSSGEAKVSTEAARQKEGTSASTAFNESIYWEAHGGNTTRANIPAIWCNTVEHFRYWRVVDQEVVLPIEDVISKLEGFKSTRTTFAGITLGAISQATTAQIWWNGADGVALGRGISASDKIDRPGDILRESPLKPGTIYPALPLPVQPDPQWTVINSNNGLYGFLSDLFGQTINQYVATKVFPSLIWRLAMSDQAFSVILRLQTGLKKSSTEFTLGDGSQPTDKHAWQKKYGDYFIKSVISGKAITVAWIFTPQSSGAELIRTRRAVADELAAQNFEMGCFEMVKVASSIPCEVYMYDAYFAETKLSSPVDVLPDIAKRSYGTDQVISVGLKPYKDLDFLQSAAEATISSNVSDIGLAAVRKDQVEYAYQSIKRRPDTTPIDRSIDYVKDWSADFSQSAYLKALEDPTGNHAAATNLVADYNALYERKSPPRKPRMNDWRQCGEEAIYDRVLRWIQLSRQAEEKDLCVRSIKAASITFGLKVEPAMTDAEKIPNNSCVEPVVFSLRDQIKAMELTGVMALGDSLDPVWPYLLDDANFDKTTFPKPGRVLAYELKAPRWNGEGRAPRFTSSAGKREPKVGMEIQDFARDRCAIKTAEWVLVDLWIVSAPFKWDAIVS